MSGDDCNNDDGDGDVGDIGGGGGGRDDEALQLVR